MYPARRWITLLTPQFLIQCMLTHIVMAPQFWLERGLCSVSVWEMLGTVMFPNTRTEASWLNNPNDVWSNWSDCTGDASHSATEHSQDQTVTWAVKSQTATAMWCHSAINSLNTIALCHHKFPQWKQLPLCEKEILLSNKALCLSLSTPTAAVWLQASTPVTKYYPTVLWINQDFSLFFF